MFKKNLIYYIAVFLLLLLCACNHSGANQSVNQPPADTSYRNLQKQIDSLNNVILEQDTSLIQCLALLFEIQHNFTSMRGQKEQIMQYARTADETALEEIRNNFSAYTKKISVLLTENRNKIVEFKGLINNRNLQIAQMEWAMSDIEKEMDMRSQEIRTLEKQLKDKDSEISLLEGVLATMNKEFQNLGNTIRQQQEQLNTAWYCVADKKTLINSALISKKGKVLSIDAALAHKIDIYENKEIPVNAKKIELLTAHPTNSYKIIQPGDYVEKIQILDPDEFWSISKYCVVQIRN